MTEKCMTEAIHFIDLKKKQKVKPICKKIVVQKCKLQKWSLKTSQATKIN